MNFDLKTNYKSGDWFRANEANDTNKAILELNKHQELSKTEIDNINDMVGDEKLNTENKTLTGAINELKELTGEITVDSINKKEINELFKNK